MRDPWALCSLLCEPLEPWGGAAPPPTLWKKGRIHVLVTAPPPLAHSTCRGRRWECSDRPCLGTCVAYGDGHFLTFDGERYGFEGSCEYTLAQVRRPSPPTAMTPALGP